MTLLLVRHAVALRRKDWTKPDSLRPLTPHGYDQAEHLPAALADFAIDRILSSPFVRCIETVEPMALRLGLPIEEVPQLREGSGATAAELLRDLEGNVVACSHGDVVPDLLAVLAPDAVREADEVACAKGSTWVVDPGRSAHYLSPPR